MKATQYGDWPIAAVLNVNPPPDLAAVAATLTSSSMTYGWLDRKHSPFSCFDVWEHDRRQHWKIWGAHLLHCCHNIRVCVRGNFDEQLLPWSRPHRHASLWRPQLWCACNASKADQKRRIASWCMRSPQPLLRYSSIQSCVMALTTTLGVVLQDSFRVTSKTSAKSTGRRAGTCG